MIDVDREKAAVQRGALRTWTPEQIDTFVLELLGQVGTLSEVIDGYQLEYAALTEKAERLAREQDPRRRMH